MLSHHPTTLHNLLPYDGTVLYYGRIMAKKIADYYFNQLLANIEWKNDEAKMFGKHYITKRKVAWYGLEPFEYTYSKITKSALPYTQELIEISELIYRLTNTTYNACLLNLYHNGSESMAWHSDAEKMLKKNGAIASISLGAERKFSFKHKETKEVKSILLEHGSLLIMQDETQSHWLHRLPPTTKIETERINLTFRTIIKEKSS
ncbi:alpha-ketoglutarate-dependent dioxygenase AlkB family protein [Pedobacter flavus]|uniref:Alpha-ketoglutarate-dependent dioxygenase AlkB n=1 Tax=Pedobacter flavus TaxID=3113906 RepID=A0ABU7H2T9_9SPHI|nr:alpha-ketoglutarate-dependent dioxygenase AlkB [Pedobacter sp. VNH31]MEE1885528.1 alpha-ketoglutarate-dependent dioxygenase AlkB [Pedobacter sp. VNH31]